MHITIEWTAKLQNQVTADAHQWGQLCNQPIYLSTSNQTLEIEDPKHKICAIGHPFINDKIKPENFLASYIQNSTNANFLQSINGEFLLIDIDKQTDTLRVVNSRFASPIFWYVSERNYFLGSTSYLHLCQILKKRNLFVLNEQPFLEYLYFKRLFGTKTYDQKSRYLKPASILTITQNTITEKAYWALHYKRNKQNLKENAHTLSQAIRKSIARKSSDDKRYGLFLSGGLDTRTLLAHMDQPITSFTITHSKNREYQVAKQLADWKQSNHIWIQVNEGHYKKHLEESIDIRGGMYMPDALFLGHSETVKQYADVIFAGYGFDYFFQGMYLPAQNRQILGRQTLFKNLAPLPQDLASYFVDNISYRTKGLPIDNLLKTGYSKNMRAYFHQEIQALIEEAQALAQTPFDIWEYLSLGYVSRHYTYGGQLNLMKQAEYRTVSYDNDLYDLYLTLPEKHRFDASAFRYALKIANPQFYNYMSANHGYPAGHPAWAKGLYNIKDRLAKRFSPRQSPSFNIKFERTWLPLDHILKTELLDQIQGLKQSEHLAQLSFLDMDKLSHNIDQWQQGALIGDQTFALLLSTHKFLSTLNQH